MPRAVRVVSIALAALLAASAASHAEESWVRGTPLEIRSGSSTGYRVLGRVEPGERVEVLRRGEGWARIRSVAGQEGWVPAEHLDGQAPPLARVHELEEEAARLRGALSANKAEREHLEQARGELEGRDSERDAELERLLRENAQLAAGLRWVEWLTGASILAFGMLVGSLLRGVLSGRRASRIRL